VYSDMTNYMALYRQYSAVNFAKPSQERTDLANAATQLEADINSLVSAKGATQVKP
jgi:hypothetical protein